MKPSKLIAAATLCLGLSPAVVQAQVSRVFVSVNGNDANDCLQPATSCRTLNGGIAKVDPQGDVIVIDTGSFAGATVTKSVKIDVPSGAIAFSALSIVINAPGATAIEFNLQFRNTGVCELIVGSDATRLLSFNTLPHLDRADRRASITFA